MASEEHGGSAGGASGSERIIVAAGKRFEVLVLEPRTAPSESGDEASPRGRRKARPLYDRFAARDAATGELVTVTAYSKAASQALSLSALDTLASAPRAPRALLRVRHVARSSSFEGFVPAHCSRVGATVLVTDLIPRVELFDVLERTGRIAEPLARLYTRQLAEAVAWLHERRIAHGDLRPENLGLDSGLDLQILSLSACQTTGADGSLQAGVWAAGSCSAPEVMATRPGERGAQGSFRAAAADVWAVGCVLFTMLAGFPPLGQACDDDWWFRTLRDGNFPLFWKAHAAHLAGALPGSDGARSLMERMFVVDPAERASLDEVLADPWLCGGDDGEAVTVAKRELSDAISRKDVARRQPDGAEGKSATPPAL